MVQPYTLNQANELVVDAVRRSKKRHGRWRMLEHVFRTGRTEGAVAASDVPGQLWAELDGLTLDAINYTLPHLSIIIETVAARDPEMNVEPYGGGEEAEVNARVGEVTLRYYWKRQKVTKRVLRDMTQDAVVIGNGFGKVGWAHSEAERDRDPAELEEELADLLDADRRDAILGQRPPTDVDTLADRVSLTELVALVDEPYVEYVSPYDIFVPDNARRLEETPWVAQRIVMRADEVRDNDQFDEAARANLRPITLGDPDQVDRGVRGDDELDDGRFGGGEIDGDADPFEHVELYEFYDMRTRRMIVFQLHAGRALFDDVLPYEHRHSPFVHLRNFNDGGSRFWSFGDLENIASIQHQLNEYVNEQAENARRSGNKYLIDSRAMNDEVRGLLESDQPDVAIPIDIQGGRMDETVYAVERKGLSQDVYAAKDDMREALREVLGLNDFQTGGVGADRMSATAAAVADGTATLRAAGKEEQVEQAAGGLGLRMLLLCQEFMDVERAVRVAGPQGVAWVNVSKADLKGEYDVSVEVGSTKSVNPSTRQQRALEMLGTVLPALTEHGYDPTPMWRHIVRDLGYDPDQVLKPAEQPAEPADGGPPNLPPAGGVPHMDALAELGGPPVPAAVDGGIAL